VMAEEALVLRSDESLNHVLGHLRHDDPLPVFSGIQSSSVCTVDVVDDGCLGLGVDFVKIQPLPGGNIQQPEQCAQEHDAKNDGDTAQIFAQEKITAFPMNSSVILPGKCKIYACGEKNSDSPKTALFRGRM